MASVQRDLKGRSSGTCGSNAAYFNPAYCRGNLPPLLREGNPPLLGHMVGSLALLSSIPVVSSNVENSAVGLRYWLNLRKYCDSKLLSIP